MTYKTISIEDILHGYERTRLANKRLLQERRADIYAKFPRIEEIDAVISASYLRAARLNVLGTEEAKRQIDDIRTANRKRTEEKRTLLVEAGYSADYLDPVYTCKICQDTGYVGSQKCACFMNRMIDSLYLQSNLKNVLEKENFQTFSLDYYSKEPYNEKEYSPYENISNILSRSRQFIARFETTTRNRGNLLIYGETGLGKTFLTNCIAKELLDHGHSVLYLSANELFESILAEYLMNQKTELEDLYNYIYNSELLIIDDLGTELTNNFVLSQLFEIINKREIGGLSTLISTNLTMKQLRDRYSERIMSRIIADYTVFNIYGDNIRYQKRKKAIHAVT